MARAERRADYERRKLRAERIVRRWYRGGELATPHRIGRLANTGKPCSCWACGNPRRHFGERTVQERRKMQGV